MENFWRTLDAMNFHLINMIHWKTQLCLKDRRRCNSPKIVALVQNLLFLHLGGPHIIICYPTNNTHTKVKRLASWNVNQQIHKLATTFPYCKLPLEEQQKEITCNKQWAQLTKETITWISWIKLLCFKISPIIDTFGTLSTCHLLPMQPFIEQVKPSFPIHSKDSKYNFISHPHWQIFHILME
jgi:hypothetical protein